MGDFFLFGEGKGVCVVSDLHLRKYLHLPFCSASATGYLAGGDFIPYTGFVVCKRQAPSGRSQYS